MNIFCKSRKLLIYASTIFRMTKDITQPYKNKLKIIISIHYLKKEKLFIASKSKAFLKRLDLILEQLVCKSYQIA